MLNARDMLYAATVLTITMLIIVGGSILLVGLGVSIPSHAGDGTHSKTSVASSPFLVAIGLILIFMAVGNCVVTGFYLWHCDDEDGEESGPPNESSESDAEAPEETPAA